jgi:hypothetical protein
LLRLAETAPLYGHGISASGRVDVHGNLIFGTVSENNVSSNWILAMWVDGKLLALPLITLLLVVAALRAGTIPGQLLVIALANSIFSNATYVPIVWALLGLVSIKREELIADKQPGLPGRQHASDNRTSFEPRRSSFFTSIAPPREKHGIR